jgi:hypothetical protein
MWLLSEEGTEMKLKSKSWTIVIILLLIIVVSTCAYFGYRYIPTMSEDKTWIVDFGYEGSEIHRLTFSWSGDRSCPEIPIKTGGDEYRLIFDTGCGSGIFFTDVLEDKINYTFLNKVEERNIDGSHRGWAKSVEVDEINIFGNTYKNIKTSISDWTMSSSEKFNGTIGLAYFKSKIITLDYSRRLIEVSSNPIDYSKLDLNEYVVLQLHKTSSKGQEDLPFFEAEFNGKPVIVYLDTGKNYSYVYNPNCKFSMTDKPTDLFDVPIKIGDIEIMLDDVAEVNDLAQADGLPYPTMIELNSDQLWKCNLIVTFDLIEQKIIFRKRI